MDGGQSQVDRASGQPQLDMISGHESGQPQMDRASGQPLMDKANGQGKDSQCQGETLPCLFGVVHLGLSTGPVPLPFLFIDCLCKMTGV